MVYQANKELEYYVSKKANGSLYGLISAIVLLIIASFAFYYNSSSFIAFTINLIIAAFISCSLAYSITVMEGKKLNKIIKEVILIDGKITFLTYSYQCLFYVIKPRRYELNQSELKMQEVGFPFNSSGLTNNKTFRIDIDEVRVYLCYCCFDDDVYLALSQM